MFASGSPSTCNHVVDQETDLTENIFVIFWWVVVQPAWIPYL